MEAVFADEAPAGGIHDLRSAGPSSLPGTVPARNGRVPGSWVCMRCSRRAGDTSRAKELVRQPCSGAVWEAEAAAHVLVAEGEGWRCSRCLLAVRPQHAAQTERQRCPVPIVSRAGVAWPEGEAGLRAAFGRLRAYRIFCCPAEAKAEHEQQPPEPPQQGQPVQQQWLVQLAELPADLAEEAGPLARAAGADCRRQLKRAEAAPSAGGSASSAGGGSLLAEPPDEPPAARRRLVSPQRVSAFSVLRPYAQHKVAFIGRNLWCLDCFEVPRSAHRSWRHGRCGGAKPPTSMPPALRDGILRQRAACSKLKAGNGARWAVLAGALGLH